jgi:xanthine dehydrogenase molybdopterin-binding subunit B
VVVEDAGRLINPMIVEGQIHGGVTQGIANALYEKVIYDDPEHTLAVMQEAPRAVFENINNRNAVES